MLSVIYSAMSGLQSFSKGLDVISGNVANLPRPAQSATEHRDRKPGPRVQHLDRADARRGLDA